MTMMAIVEPADLGTLQTKFCVTGMVVYNN